MGELCHLVDELESFVQLIPVESIRRFVRLIHDRQRITKLLEYVL